MNLKPTDYAQARAGLFDWIQRHDWTLAQVCRALNAQYSSCVYTGLLIKLLRGERGAPVSKAVWPVRRFLTDHPDVGSFADWLEAVRAHVRGAPTERDRIIAQVEAKERTRAAYQARCLAREVRHCRALPPPSHEFDGLDGATLAALSGGTITGKGQRRHG